MIILKILSAWLLADFLSGVAHWAQDRMLVYGKSKFINMVIDENVLHHTKPGPWKEFLFLKNIRISVVTTWPVAALLYFRGSPTVLWLAIFFVSFGNAVHFFSHQRKLPRIVRILQATGLFASFEHHKLHHASGGKLINRHEAHMRYCVMTNWVNPVLDGLKFFGFLEGTFHLIARVRPKLHFLFVLFLIFGLSAQATEFKNLSGKMTNFSHFANEDIKIQIHWFECHQNFEDCDGQNDHEQNLIVPIAADGSYQIAEIGRPDYIWEGINFEGWTVSVIFPDGESFTNDDMYFGSPKDFKKWMAGFELVRVPDIEVTLVDLNGRLIEADQISKYSLSYEAVLNQDHDDYGNIVSIFSDNKFLTNPMRFESQANTFDEGALPVSSFVVTQRVLLQKDEPFQLGDTFKTPLADMLGAGSVVRIKVVVDPSRF